MTLVTDGLEIPDAEAHTFAIYRNVKTSEVFGSEHTFCGALALHEATPGAEIICNGMLYAGAVWRPGGEQHWILTKEGKAQLAEEHELLLQRWRK